MSSYTSRLYFKTQKIIFINFEAIFNLVRERLFSYAYYGIMFKKMKETSFSRIHNFSEKLDRIIFNSKPKKAKLYRKNRPKHGKTLFCEKRKINFPDMMRK